MEFSFTPQIFKNYRVTETKGFYPANIRSSIKPISDSFQKNHHEYSDEEKFEILKSKNIDTQTIFHIFGYNNVQFEHALRILEKHKDKGCLELDCLINYPEKEFRYIMQFLDFGIDPIEIKELFDIGNERYKTVLEQISKIEGLSENYKNNSFNIHIGVKDNKEVLIEISWLEDGENITNKEDPKAREVNLVKHIDENGGISTQRYEIIPDDCIKSSLKDSDIIFYTKLHNDEILEQFEISNGKIIHKKLSEILPFVYDITSYNLEDFNEQSDIIEAIRQNKLDGKTLSRTMENDDGTKTYFENYNNIKRKYTVKNNGEYQYSIQTPFFSLSKAFRKVSHISTETIVNGKKYLAEFDNKKQTIIINKEKIIDIGNISNNNSTLWRICKEIPGDILYNFDIVKSWNCCKNIQSSWKSDTQTLESGDKIGILAHEMGHAVDRIKLNLSGDTKLMQIFNKEKRKYYNKCTFPGGVDQMYHLIDEYNDVREIIAETSMLLTMPGSDFLKTTRSQILMHNFPETMGYIANKINDM